MPPPIKFVIPLDNHNHNHLHHHSQPHHPNAVPIASHQTTEIQKSDSQHSMHSPSFSIPLNTTLNMSPTSPTSQSQSSSSTWQITTPAPSLRQNTILPPLAPSQAITTITSPTASISSNMMPPMMSPSHSPSQAPMMNPLLFHPNQRHSGQNVLQLGRAPTQSNHQLLAATVPQLMLKRFLQIPKLPTALERIPVHACVLLADVSGFTRMAERFSSMGHHGVEELTSHLNKYFDKMIQIIGRYGGDIIKFAGDALLIVWSDDHEYTSMLNSQPSHSSPVPRSESKENIGIESTELLQRLVRLATGCALELNRELNDYEVSSGLKLYLHSGLGCGKVDILNLGGHDGKWEYLIVGDPIFQISEALVLAKQGEVVISSACHAQLTDCCDGVLLKNGYLQVQKLGAFPQPGGRIDNFPQEYAPLLHAYINKSVLVRMHAGYSLQMLNEIRSLSVMFVTLPGLDFRGRNSAIVAHKFLLASQKCLRKLDGSIRQYIVDDKGCVLIACFGLPSQTHEDDAFRCVSAAQSIQKESSSLGMASSFGITTGSIFCGVVGNSTRWDYSLVGDIVNLASRLSTATVDKIVCDEETMKKCAERGLKMGFFKSLTVKGKIQPIPAYIPTTDLQKPKVDAHQPISFQGRTREKLLFQDILKETSQDQITKVVVIQGESGMGKSELLSELHNISNGLALNSLMLSCKEYSHSILGVWRRYLAALSKKDLRQVDDLIRHLPMVEDGSLDCDIIDPFFNIAKSEQADVKKEPDVHNPARRMKRAVNSVAFLNRTSTASAASNSARDSLSRSLLKRDHLRYQESTTLKPSGGSQATLRAGNISMVYRAHLSDDANSLDISMDLAKLERLLIYILGTKMKDKQPPFVLLIDDIDLLEELSGDILVSIMKSFRPLLLIASTQVFESRCDVLERIGRFVFMKNHKLEGLDQQEISELSRSNLHVMNLASKLEAALVERSIGNPFLLLQILSSYQERGYLVIDADTQTARLSELGMENSSAESIKSVASMISRRVDELDFSKQLLIKVLSCIGEIFPLSVVKALLQSLEGKEQIWSNINTSLIPDIRTLVESNFLEIVDFEAHIGRSIRTDSQGLVKKWTTQILRAQQELIYKFVGGSTRQTILNLVTNEQKSVVSLQIAVIYETMFQGQLDLYYKDIADHWMSAGNMQKAMLYTAKAGVFAVNSNLVSKSIELLNRALQLSQETHAPTWDRLSWMRLLAVAYRIRGKDSELARIFNDGIQLLVQEEIVASNITTSTVEPSQHVFSRMNFLLKSVMLCRTLTVRKEALGILRDGKIRDEAAKFLVEYSSHVITCGSFAIGNVIGICIAIIRLCAPLGYSDELVYALLLSSMLLAQTGHSMNARYFRKKATEIQDLCSEPLTYGSVQQLWYQIYLSDGQISNALDLLGFAEPEDDSFDWIPILDPRFKEQSFFDASICYYHRGEYKACEIVATECQESCRTKESYTIESSVAGYRLICLLRMGCFDEARALLGAVDYKGNTLDAPNRIILKSCAFHMYAQDRKVPQVFDMLDEIQAALESLQVSLT
eukprot:TRINITY_DN2342_c0_g1_i1.p1 TRINITY_DN2342_c0_g1~~TRINITY_DN2342_c0_g1_i1.p1  ORF type:complete len:1544 (+),score=309.01 TRINITY_DN2342_c0_g1_i1:168-4799(+)